MPDPRRPKRRRWRPWPRRVLPRSTALRLALYFLLVFGGASGLLMLAIYGISGQVLMAQVDHGIEEDIAELLAVARHRGDRALAVHVVRQARRAGEARSVFLLVDAKGQPLAGSLAAWPDAIGSRTEGWATLPRDALEITENTLGPDPDSSGRGFRNRPRVLPPPNPGPGADQDPEAEVGTQEEPAPPPVASPPWSRLRSGPPPFGPFADTAGAPRHWPPHGLRPQPRADRVRLAVVSLPQGQRLLVGRDLGPVALVRSRMASAMRLGLVLMVGLGLLGGLVMSRRIGRRLEAINRTSQAIMGGDLSRRVPQGKGLDGDDIDQVAAGLNAMLARIETLMAGVRHVSDTIAHDLRTPLGRLRNRLEGLRDAAEHRARTPNPDPEADTDGLDAALAEVDGLLATFNALLRIAQVETGGRRMAFAPLDLAPLLTDVAELYDAVAADRGLSLDMRLQDAAPAAILGDRDLLFQAFANLLDNAVKYSPEAGRVTLTLGSGAKAGSAAGGTPGTTLTVSVADQGPGIPPEDRARVFERFARLDAARSTPGNGLGLTMVAAVVEAHGGEITLTDAPGGGLLARVTLPALSHTANDTPATERDASRPA